MHHSTCRALKFFCLSVMVLIVTTTHAQFRGGNDDGHSLGFAGSQPLGQNIFLGGNDDGFAFSFAGNQPFGQNIFTGGIDDGFSMAFMGNQPFGQNIFVGGIDDGFSMAAAGNQPFGQNIFLGGIDDGFTTSLAGNQSLGQNIFLGGVDDGWAFAMGSNLVLLPVVLKTFGADWKNEEDVLTRWITSSEANTDHFEIQRSINGSNFESVGSVPAAGNSSTERTYLFTDVKVNANYTTLPPQLYYRLKTVDRDGHVSYSAIVVLNNRNTGNAESVSVYPNPAQQYIVVEVKSASAFKPKTLQLVSSDGKVLLQTTLTDARQTLQVGAYASGTYYLKIIDKDNKHLQTLKFIIQH